MYPVVTIPNVDRDERIGSAFNHLFQVIQSTEDCQADRVSWNLSRASFFHPFFLAPLAIYRQQCEKGITCLNVPRQLSGYLDLIGFEKPLHLDAGMQAYLHNYLSKSYIPVCQFDLHKSGIDLIQGVLQNLIRQQSKVGTYMTTPLSYFLSELIDNMNEHSRGEHGYVFSQYLRKEGCIDLVLADDGITVLGSYIAARKYMDEINGDEAEALRLANEGRSTKNRPEAENRGYGISSSKGMLVEGLGGSFFMLSGGAFHRHDRNGSVFVKLPQNIAWNGTIILMRIPTAPNPDFNYMKFIR